MLVLTRKLQQQIKIGDQITVTVLRVKGNTVRIGVQAPREVRVIRGELPKVAAGQDEQIAATEVSTIAVSEITSEELAVLVESTEVAPAASAAVNDDSPATVRARHLPLQRIRDRYGVAPLKQVIASCATLAK